MIRGWDFRRSGTDMLNTKHRVFIRTLRNTTAAAWRGMAVVGLLVFAGSAHAQWTVTNLNPAGATASWARGGAGTQQVGGAIIGGAGHAGLWNGTAASWLDLNPAGATSSQAYASSPGAQQQVGQAFLASFPDIHAGLWSGSAASWVDLNPVGSAQSIAYATSGTQQVGYATIGNSRHAGRWSGSAASWIDMNPTGSTGSEALAISGTQQVGYATVGNASHAGRWSGSAVSWVDLHPAGWTESIAYATSGAQQAGRVLTGSATVSHAGIWTGSAASWVDLNPAGSTYSWVNATSGAQQVGGAYFNGFANLSAGIWSGTAASWEVLPMPLTGSLDGAVATSIWDDGSFTYVTGWGVDWATNSQQALLWSRPLPEPGSAALICFIGLMAIRRRRC